MEGTEDGKAPVLQWEMAASPAWTFAMEDGAELDLCASQPTLRATGGRREPSQLFGRKELFNKGSFQSRNERQGEVD